MPTFLKKAAVLLIILYIAAPILGQYVGDDAPSFTIMQYKDETFNTDTVYNKKVVTFVFGSITWPPFCDQYSAAREREAIYQKYKDHPYFALYDIYHWEAHPTSGDSHTNGQFSEPSTDEHRALHYEKYVEKFNMTCPGLVDDGQGRNCIVSKKWRANYTTIVTVDIEGVIQYRKDFPNNFSNAYSGLDSKIEDLLADVDTTSPSVTVQSPSTNDILVQGTAAEIKWTANDNIDVEARAIYFSSDDGANWSLIDSAQTNTGSYSWTVPNNSSSLCLVEVRAYDKMGNDGIGQSDKFSISATAITNKLANVVNKISYRNIKGDMYLTIPMQINHTFQIFDLMGRNIISKEQIAVQQYNISKMVPAGTYIIRLIGKDIQYVTPLVVSK